LDGRWLIVNGDGRLWRVAAEGAAELERIDVQGIPELNNDHVLAPDGEHIYLSANDGHVYRAPLAGGRAGRITNTDRPERMHYLHGVSPDGELLSYIGLEPVGDGWSANVFVIAAVGGADRQLTQRMRSDGSDPQQLSFDERVNWFPVRRYDLDVQFEAHRDELDKIKSLVA
jgi:TolB protein